MSPCSQVVVDRDYSFLEAEVVWLSLRYGRVERRSERLRTVSHGCPTAPVPGRRR